jgi:hypothetical protein
VMGLRIGQSWFKEDCMKVKVRGRSQEMSSAARLLYLATRLLLRKEREHPPF